VNSKIMQKVLDPAFITLLLLIAGFCVFDNQSFVFLMSIPNFILSSDVGAHWKLSKTLRNLDIKRMDNDKLF
jgi:hypothetical protein